MWVRLPYLKPAEDVSLKDAWALWPGLPGRPDTHWEPENYPFTQVQAANLYREFSTLDMADLESLRLRLSIQRQMADFHAQDERNCLAQFAGLEAQQDLFHIFREQAHKTLIWRWHMEEQLAEIARLEARCNLAEKLLAEPLMEIPSKRPVLSDPARLDASWKPILFSAAWFFPYSIKILIEGDMFVELRETLDFAVQEMLADDHALLCCKAPLWKALGWSQPARDKDQRIDDIFNTDRIWAGII